MAAKKDYIYTAGLFDGEGSICYPIAWRKHYCYRRVNLSIVNTNQEVIDWLHNTFGGTKAKYDPKGNRKVKFSWVLTDKEKILAFLLAIKPYSIVKKKHLVTTIRFISALLKRRPSRSPKKLDSTELLIREDYHQEISALNHRGR